MYAPYIFLALGAVALIAFCITRDRRSSATAISFKTVASMMFIAVAVAAILVRRENPVHLVPALLMVGGLVCGLVGDITLDFKIFLKGLSYDRAERDADIMTYLGMAAFGVGHVLYITASALRFAGTEMHLLWSALVAVGLVAAIFALSIGVMKMRFGKFLVPSISYALLLCFFVVYSVWQMVSVGSSTANVLLLLGAVFFIISDLILSMTYFSKPEDYQKSGMMHPESKLMIVANHVTYYIAQFLIALAILFI